MRPLLLLAALSALLSNACYPAGDGKAPPLEELYFPTGLALDDNAKSTVDDESPKYLYVVNSDFDLQYRASSVISYDLDRVRELVPFNCSKSSDCSAGFICDAPGVEGVPSDPLHGPSYFCVDPQNPSPCGAFGARDEADAVLNPGRCQSIDPNRPQDGSASPRVARVGIGAFATDVIWRLNPDGDKPRLFIPVRGDGTLHWIDLTKDGHFDCGQDNGTEDDGCDSLHRSGNTVSDNADALIQPPEPFGLDATADGAYIAVANQTTGTVSLYANDWDPSRGAVLSSILGGLPPNPVSIAALPEVEYADGTQPAPGFLVAYRTSAQVDLLRVHQDAPVSGTALQPYTRYSLRRAGSTQIFANSLGFDSRGIAIDDRQRQQDYATCQRAAADCTATPEQCSATLSLCLRTVHQPAVYVANRAPASLLVGAMTTDTNYRAGTSELPSFTDTVSMTFGPSRVVLGDVRVPGNEQSVHRDSAGPWELERRVFVVCFDSRRIFVYDPKRRVIEAIVNTGRGPAPLAVDSARGLAYVGHFTDSYLGVISLDQRFPQTYATIVASIGVPKPPRSSK